MSEILSPLTAAFAKTFGAAPALVARAPGRVNLIGEHTDYNDGFVLPAAIGVHTLVALAPRVDCQIHVIASDFAGAASQFSLDAPILPDPAQPWADYVRGMVVQLQSVAEAKGIALSGLNLAIAGSVPQGSGLSSSASLAVAVGTAINAASGLGLDATEIALLAQSCECEFVGTKCGIMDQLVSARGEAGHVLLIDCRSLACTPVPVPADVAIMIVHSGVTRGLVEGHYNQRRQQCESAARILGVPALRDADMVMLTAAKPRLDPVDFLRARHVITENARTLAATQAFQANDLATLGELMAESHASMRDDFAITTPEVDALAAELHQLIAGEGGARMTGGGFGGAVVAIMRQSHAAEVAARLTYRTPSGQAPLIMIEQASAGAGLI